MSSAFMDFTALLHNCIICQGTGCFDKPSGTTSSSCICTDPNMDKLEDPIYDMTYTEMEIWNKFCELRDIRNEMEALKDKLSRERFCPN